MAGVARSGARRRSTRSGRMPAHCSSAGSKLADAGDLDGAIAAHEAALARDPSLAQAHANLISLYGRTQQLGEGGGALPRGRRARRRCRRTPATTTASCSAMQEQVGAPRPTRIARRSRSIRCMREAHNNLGQILERQRQFDAAAAEYRQAVDSQPTFRLARFNLGRMLDRARDPTKRSSELQKLTEPRDAEAPRYLFALATAHVRAGHRDEGDKWADRGAPAGAAVRADTSSRRPSSAIWRRSNDRALLSRRAALRAPRSCARAACVVGCRCRTRRPPTNRSSSNRRGRRWPDSHTSTARPGSYYMPEQMGAGVALFDYDNDGDLDVFLVQGGPLGRRDHRRRVLPTPAGCFATT